MTRFELFFNDQRAVFITSLWSIASGVAWGVFAEVVIKVDFERAAYQCIAIVICIYAVRLWSFCRSVKILPATANLFGVDWRRLSAALFLCLVAFVWYFNLPALEAKVLYQRLSTATHDVLLSSESTHQIARSLDFRARYHVIIPPQVLSAVAQDLLTTLSKGTLVSSDVLEEARRVLVTYDLTPGDLSRESEAKRSFIAGIAQTAQVMNTLNTAPLNQALAGSAIAELTNSIKLAHDPHLRAYGKATRAELYSLLGSYDAALQDIAEAQKWVYPGLAVRIRALILFRRRAEQDLSIAESLFTQALANPLNALDKADNYANRGLTRAALGHMDEAISDMRAAIMLQPTQPLFRRDLARMLANSGRLKGAQE